MQRKVYILEGLDCANCASKIERKLSKMPGLEDVSVTYATKQLRLSTEDPDAMLPKIVEAVKALEPDVEVVERKRGSRTKTAAAADNHEDGCCGGHNHEHEHNHDHGHGHDHEDGCCGGHDHEHDHNHDHGHDHGHDHDHEDGCCGGHDHEHDHGHSHDHDHDHEGGCCGGHDHEHDHSHDHGHDHGHDHSHGHDHDHEGGCCGGHDHEEGPHATRSHTHFVDEYHHVPGHPDDCDCEECHSHAEYCDVCGQSLANCNCRMPDEDMEKRVYILEGLDCANCAMKIEAKVRSMPEVAFASVAYATKQLRVSANHQDELLPKMQAAIDAIEDGITVVPRHRKKISSVSDTKIYILEGLDCANCAAKVESKLKQMDGVDDVTITYATKQMKLSAKNPDELVPKIQAAIDAIEDGITVVPKDTKPAAKKKEKDPIWKNPLFTIALGAVLFVIGYGCVIIGGMEESDLRLLPIFVVAYLVLGGKVLLAAGKNMSKGQIFDENFLMCIATLGAFAIQEFPEAVGVMLFYRIGEYFEDRATEQSRSQIMEAVDLRPEVVNLVVGDDIKVIDAEEANVGDIVLVRPGDRIPLDGVIIDGESRIDTSPVTGEPVPVMARTGDLVVSGCVNTSGQLKVRVEKVLEESMVTRILDSVENAAASKPNIDKFITKFARIYTPFVVFFAIAVAILIPLIPGLSDTWTWLPQGGHTGHSSVYTALTFLVISCPCALVLSVPLAFFSGIGAGSKKGILFKGGIAIEGLKNVKAVVMDKTGTITKGNFVVQRANPANGILTPDELLAVSASCELSSTHPIGNSIVDAAKEKGIDIERPGKVEEIAGHGIKAEISKGTVLCGNRKLMDANQINMSSYVKEDFGTEVLVALNGKFVGNIVISDTVKEDAAPAIKAVKNLGIITAMLTGDAQESAEAVAKETGVDEVHAKLLPEDKLSELVKIREAHGAVMFVGDGINDAPVLAGADVGAAMGSGADAAIEAADVVFMNSEMNAIPEALSIARQTSKISWQNVYFALAIKIIVMIAGLFGFANMWVAVFADTGVSVLCLLNSIRILKRK